MVITLIGYRGCGKSSVAPRLAQRLSWTWIDADVELEQRTGRSIREIFATDGELEFRRLERETLVELLKRDRLVLAAGGGAVLNAETRADFRAAGPVVWLRASVETIARRILRDSPASQRRPNLTARGGVDEIRELLAVRTPLYEECATITVDTNDRPLFETVAAILERLPADLAGARL